MSLESRSKLREFIHFLEDPEYPSVAPNIWLLGISGLWHPNHAPAKKFKLIVFFLTIAFFFSQYIKCCINFDAVGLKLILQYAPFHMGIIKACFFKKDYKQWAEIIHYTSINECDQISKKDKSLNSLINEYVNRSRRITYFFWALAFFSNLTIFTEPYQKNQVNENGTSTYIHIFDAYTPLTPFDKEPPGYYASMIMQTIFGHIVSVYVVGWDTFVVTIMIFFAGQLKIARYYCLHFIDVKNISQSHTNIEEFHKYYMNLLKYQKIFSSIISPIMFGYLVVVSINLGICIIQINELQDDLVTLVSSVVFVLACLIQLLIFYWHANDVTEESMLVSYATFESDWIEADLELQKKIALLGVATSKTLVFKAGPFTKMSLTTFIGILRSSYSFYTLLNGTN